MNVYSVTFRRCEFKGHTVGHTRAPLKMNLLELDPCIGPGLDGDEDDVDGSTATDQDSVT